MTADGYYVTGDVMRRDADGFYYFVGRADDMFVCGGENIYPGEVETMLERHPGIRQACVVPVPDEVKGSQAGGLRRAGGRAPARAPRRSSSGRSPTDPPTSTRATSSSWPSCRWPEPARSTARR